MSSTNRLESCSARPSAMLYVITFYVITFYVITLYVITFYVIT
jgi:hypothetical protein